MLSPWGRMLHHRKRIKEEGIRFRGTLKAEWRISGEVVILLSKGGTDVFIIIMKDKKLEKPSWKIWWDCLIIRQDDCLV